MAQYMRDIPVRNPELISILDRYVDVRKTEGFSEHVHLNCKPEKDNRHYWVGHDYLKDLVTGKEKQDGFPDAVYGYELGIHREGHNVFERSAPAVFRKDLVSELATCRDQLIDFIGTCRHQALCAVYPPGGFISWHNNANAPGWNLIFTHSEDDGKGYFEYLDPTTKEIVRMTDHKGWQCKAAYFGSWKEKDKIFYHAASTDVWRMTLSFVFSMDEAGDDIREEIIADIMGE